MFVTNWISPTKIQKISEITNFFRHYFLSRTEVYICHSFVPSGFRLVYARPRMKRESGESPGQSRCCKLLCKGLFTTSGHCFLLFEKVGRHNKPE